MIVVIPDHTHLLFLYLDRSHDVEGTGNLGNISYDRDT